MAQMGPGGAVERLFWVVDRGYPVDMAAVMVTVFLRPLAWVVVLAGLAFFGGAWLVVGACRGERYPCLTAAVLLVAALGVSLFASVG